MLPAVFIDQAVLRQNESLGAEMNRSSSIKDPLIHFLRNIPFQRRDIYFRIVCETEGSMPLGVSTRRLSEAKMPYFYKNFCFAHFFSFKTIEPLSF